jgi:hypothetical protein
MLPDRRIELERWARENTQRERLPRAFGKFVAELAEWDWFINPLSFRDRISGFGPPVSNLALKGITEFLLRVQSEAGRPVGWVIAEEYGQLGERYHSHALITGVRHLSREDWEKEAFRRFGRTRFQVFDRQHGAAVYVTKYAGKLTDRIDFGGFLRGGDLAKCVQSRSFGGCRDVVKSQPLPQSYFHRCLPRWHR